MNCQISIVNFNTTSMTNAALKSIRKFSQLPIVVFDNSNREKFQLDSDITNTVVIDNTEGEVIDFKTDLQQLDAKYKIPLIIKEMHVKGNNFGSYKHCKTIQWLLDNCKHDNMILFDSDIVVLKDFVNIVDENVITSAEVFIKNMHYSRFLPFMQYFNCKMIKNTSIKYFDESRMQDISKFYVGYDTGGSFYEDVKNKRLPVKQICLKDYILHYGAGSWKPTKYSGKLEYIEQRN